MPRFTIYLQTSTYYIHLTNTHLSDYIHQSFLYQLYKLKLQDYLIGQRRQHYRWFSQQKY